MAPLGFETSVIGLHTGLRFALCWLKILMPRRPSAFGTWIGLLALTANGPLALTASKGKSWKRGTARPMGSRAPAAPLPQCFSSLLPCLPGSASLAFGKAGLCLERALLSKGELAVHKCSSADPGRRCGGEKSSLFSDRLCKAVNGKFCFLRWTSPWPQQTSQIFQSCLVNDYSKVLIIIVVVEKCLIVKHKAKEQTQFLF